MIDSNQFPVLSGLVAEQCELYPAHAKYLEKRFASSEPDHLKFCESLATYVDKIIDHDRNAYLEGYDFLTKIVIEEEIFFRRNGRYRLSSFAQANEEIYSDRPYMTKYMNGLLMSQLWWTNHTEIMRFYRDKYLSKLVPGSTHLEIGPGHGLFLYFAANHANVAHATGWDISEASVALVKESMAALGYDGDLALDLVDMFNAKPGNFDSVVFSEVLEHLEDPEAGLAAVFNALKPGGLAFINAPVNSPAPDHLKLFSDSSEIVTMIEQAGFVIEEVELAATTGASLERAKKMKLAVSTAVIARRIA